MATFIVKVSQVYVSKFMIEALDKEEAMDKVQEGDGDELECEYSHTLDRDYWSVEEEKDPQSLWKDEAFMEVVRRKAEEKWRPPSGNLWIPLIKAYREMTGLGLKEAKESIDAWRANGGIC